MTLTITHFFWLVGLFLLVVGGMIVTDRAHPKRLLAGGFWILYGLVFLIGDWLPPSVVTAGARSAPVCAG